MQIDDEVIEFCWKLYWLKEKGFWRVYSSRGFICRIEFAPNICCVEGALALALLRKTVKSLEDFVNCSVLAPSVPPPFNDSPVVTVYNEVPLLCFAISKISDQAFESDGFCPANISLSFQCLPAQDETPGSPLIADDDSDAEF